jgi:hypothetical protein
MVFLKNHNAIRIHQPRRESRGVARNAPTKHPLRHVQNRFKSNIKLIFCDATHTGAIRTAAIGIARID